MNVYKNKIVLENQNEITFEDEIFEVAKWNDKVVVALKTDFDEGCDNVYCYNVNGDWLWRIESVSKKLGVKKRAVYVGVRIIDGVCSAVDFWGRRCTVMLENGKIISVDIVK